MKAHRNPEPEEPLHVMLDDRIGSVHLKKGLRRLGVEVDVRRLKYGDAACFGEGEGGRPVRVGIELKATGDLLRCIADGRFSGSQLPGLLETYDVVYLIAEGVWRRASDGQLLIPSRGLLGPVRFGARQWMHSTVEHWLQTMEEVAGLRVRRTQNETETAELVASIAGWWDKPCAKHTSHLQLDTSRGLPKARKERAEFSRASMLRRLANVLPGVGWVRSSQVEKHFSSARAMVNASEAEWQSVPGIGKGTAARVVKACREEK